MTSPLKSARVTPPGRILKKELEARGWDQKDLAAIMGRPAQAINEIINGSKRITPETALELGEALGTSPDLWSNLEAKYRLSLAQKDSEKQGAKDDIARRSRLFGLAPFQDLLKRGWLKVKDASDIDACEEALKEFLGIATLDETPRLAAAFRHNVDRGPEANNLTAWLKRAEHLAAGQNAAEFSRERLDAHIPKLLEFSKRPEDTTQVPGFLLALGVRFVIVPHLDKTFVDGAMFYQENARPVVVMSMRLSRIDCFWFTLMHELAHIILGHPGGHVDSMEDLASLEIDDLEREANERAQSWLLSQANLRSFVARTKPYFGKTAIERFATEQGRHPGIVLGQLQKQQIVPYSHLRPLLVNVKPYLAEWLDSSGPR